MFKRRAIATIALAVMSAAGMTTAASAASGVDVTRTPPVQKLWAKYNSENKCIVEMTNLKAAGNFDNFSCKGPNKDGQWEGWA